MKLYVTERIGPKQTDARRPSVVPRCPDRASGSSPMDRPVFLIDMAASNSTPTRHLLLRDRVNMSMALVKFSTRRFGRSAGGLAPIVAPHSEERSMDSIGRLVERFQVDPHHAAVVHAPRQAHQQAIDRLLAPVGNQSAAQRC